MYDFVKTIHLPYLRTYFMDAPLLHLENHFSCNQSFFSIKKAIFFFFIFFCYQCLLLVITAIFSSWQQMFNSFYALTAIFWEHQPTWNKTPSEFANSRIFCSYDWSNKLDQIKLGKIVHCSKKNLFLRLTAKMGFFRIWAQNILRNPHKRKDIVVFQQSLCMK